MKLWSTLLTVTSALLAAPAAGVSVKRAPSPANSDLKPFTYNDTSFFLDGKPFQIMSGQTDFQRSPPELWRERLKKVRALGLNTVATYVYWDELEPEKDQFDWSGRNDISRFLKIAEEEGLKALLRAGPYICAEHEWGGFPYWLMNIEGMEVRKDNQPFYERSEKYLTELHKQVSKNLAHNGGNVLMVQIENELGSFVNYKDQSDINYKYKMRDLFLKSGFDKIPLYTCDGTSKGMILGGQVNNTLSNTDGAADGFTDRDKTLKDAGLGSSMGPWSNMEYYTTWMDQWGKKHETYSSQSIEQVKKDLTSMLKQGKGFSLYDVLGGTNFGFSNGADYGDKLTPITTSYDYGAPIDESGRTTALYDGIREALLTYLGNGHNIPDVPKSEKMISIPQFKASLSNGLFDKLPTPVKKDSPVNMEQLGQAHGYTLYRHKAEQDANGKLAPGDGPRDRVIVYVNQEEQGVIDDSVRPLNNITLDLKKGDTLDLLVENLGRVNFGGRILDQRKGVVGDVKVGSSDLKGWEIYPIGFKNGPKEYIGGGGSGNAKGPKFYQAEFNLDTVSDTFLDLPSWTKGVAWVNNHNLGRYWNVGPQNQLYVPKPYLKAGKNSIEVFELHKVDNPQLEGLTKRGWNYTTITN